MYRYVISYRIKNYHAPYPNVISILADSIDMAYYKALAKVANNCGCESSDVDATAICESGWKNIALYGIEDKYRLIYRFFVTHYMIKPPIIHSNEELAIYKQIKQFLSIYNDLASKLWNLDDESDEEKRGFEELLKEKEPILNEIADRLYKIRIERIPPYRTANN